MDGRIIRDTKKGASVAFTSAKSFAVQTGHTLTEESSGRAEVLVSP